MVRDVRAGMLSVPFRLQGRLSLTRELVNAIDDEIRDVLTIMGRSQDPATTQAQPPRERHS